MKLFTRKAFLRILILIILILFAAGTFTLFFIRMPNPPGPSSVKVNPSLVNALKNNVEFLASDIGERNFVKYENYLRAVAAINAWFSMLPSATVKIGEYKASPDFLKNCCIPNMPDRKYSNVEAVMKGSSKPEEIIIVGAHFDSVPVERCKAANDNASGVAVIMELAKMFADEKTKRTIRFVAFTNEEPPFFQTEFMGSWLYASECRRKNENIKAMICLDTVGCFYDKPDTQSYPANLGLIYPDKGNFIAFVANLNSVNLLRKSVSVFRSKSTLPLEAASVPGFIPGVDWSDHWSFWQHGFKAILVTDTALYRYPYYHTDKDTPDQLNYEKMALLTQGLFEVVNFLDKE